MKKLKVFLPIMGTIFFVALIMLLIKPVRINATEACAIVRLWGHAAPQLTVKVDPDLLTVKKGTCVVWVNWAKTPEVKVKFNEGKSCKDATKAPVGFKLDNELGCYVTDYIPEGGTSSLLFDQQGTFDYVVEAPGLGTPVKGRILVK